MFFLRKTWLKIHKRIHPSAQPDRGVGADVFFIAADITGEHHPPQQLQQQSVQQQKVQRQQQLQQQQQQQHQQHRIRVCFASFKYLSDFHRHYGCSFLRFNVDQSSVEAEESRSYHVRYWMIWLASISSACLAATLLDKTLRTVSPVGQFNITIFGFLVFSTFFEAYTAAALMRVHRRKWQAILRRCDDIEANLEVDAAMERYMRVSARYILALQGMVIVFNLAINAVNDFGLGLWLAYADSVPLSAQLISGAFSVFGGFMIPSNTTVPRVWIMYFGRLFGVYIRRINERLREVLERDLSVEEKAIAVDDIRVQLYALREVGERLSGALGVAILFGYGYTIPLLCVAGYFVTMLDVRIKIRAFFAAFGFGHALSVFVPILITAQISKDIANLKQTIEQVPASKAPLRLHTQLALLERAAVADDFRIDACGFFKVDLGLLTSIMGATVTYTVMLAQTNYLVFQKRSAAHSNNNNNNGNITSM